MPNQHGKHNTTAAKPLIDYDNLPAPTKGKPGPKLIPIEAMIDLKRRGLSNTQIGELVGCHSSNVARRLANLDQSIDLTDKYIKHRPWILAYEANRIRQSITKADIEKAGLRDKIVSMGILHDKENLAGGLPTQIILYADQVKVRKQLADERQALEAEAISVSSKGEPGP